MIGIKAFLIILFLLVAGHSQAVQYHCIASRVVDSDGKWSEEYIYRWAPGTVIIWNEAGRPDILKRCSFSMIEEKRTCDNYKIDRRSITNGIEKYYHFKGQFDVQVFNDSVTGKSKYLENNGRGTVHFGECIGVVK
jgi:hypothetical protein